MSESKVPAAAANAYKSATKPVWCPGCGDYSVLASLTKSLAALQLPAHEVAIVSGIGCSSRLPAYLQCYGFHSIHGRALPVSIGLKLARPDLTVITTGGDGDGFSIGGNHFLHACRRNVDMTYVVMDNRVYGMTKGQPSPTTESDWDMSAMAPEGGTGLAPFDPLSIAVTAGANFVARAFAGDPNGTADLITQAIRHPGFSIVVVLSPCVTYREEQRLWKEAVRPVEGAPIHDIAGAAQWLLRDDGLSIGVVYEGNRKPWSPHREPTVPVADLDRAFVLG